MRGQVESREKTYASRKFRCLSRSFKPESSARTGREQITPSEKAYAYKMKYDAIKKKAGRKNCGQVDHNTGKRSIDVIGELCGDSAKQVH